VNSEFEQAGILSNFLRHEASSTPFVRQRYDRNLTSINRIKFAADAAG